MKIDFRENTSQKSQGTKEEEKNDTRKAGKPSQKSKEFRTI